ncbi:hypothetical protein GEMRC1_005333 [Eukaryota sp. GEM-RC1]
MFSSIYELLKRGPITGLYSKQSQFLLDFSTSILKILIYTFDILFFSEKFSYSHSLVNNLLKIFSFLVDLPFFLSWKYFKLLKLDQQLSRHFPDSTVTSVFNIFEGKLSKQSAPLNVDVIYDCLVHCPALVPFSYKFKILKLYISSTVSEEKDTMNVNRQSVLESLSKEFHKRSLIDLRVKSIRISFEGEHGVDVKGVRQECFSLASTEFFKNEEIFHFNEQNQSIPARVSPKNQKLLEFCGLLLGKSLLHSLVLNASIHPLFWKFLSNSKISPSEILFHDPQLLSSISTVFSYPFVEDLGLYFTTLEGEPLIENGELVPVTDINKFYYIQKLITHTFTKHFQEPCTIVRRSLSLLCPSKYLSLFYPRELSVLICGFDSIDLDLLKQSCLIKGGDAENSTIQYLWEELGGASQERLQQFIEFVTSSPKLVVQSNDEPLLTLCLTPKSGRLPTASTCFNMLKLPDYGSPTVLSEKLWQAIESDRSFSFD